MIFEAEYGTCIFGILTHPQGYKEDRSKANKKRTCQKKGRIPLLPKGGGPLRQNLWM
jgi:hypothetical protein